MHRMKRGCRWRRHPGAGRARFWVADFRGHHFSHLVRLGPHALADLAVAIQGCFKAHIDIPILIGSDPRFRLDQLLGQESTEFHRRMDLITRAIQKTGIDKDDAVFHFPYTCLQIHRGAPLFIHHTDLDAVAWQTEAILHSIE